jgi:hypothetical protein
MINHLILSRLDQLIEEGTRKLETLQQSSTRAVEDQLGWARWTTSSLNLLDKLSVSTNRFVREFELNVQDDARHQVHYDAALGVLQSARDEYKLGLAVEYHLSVAAAVFGGILDEAAYLQSRAYSRAAAVLIGAALEEGLKNRARAIPIEIGPKDTLNPVIAKLKAPEAGVLTEFDAKRLEAIAKMRNDAAR